MFDLHVRQNDRYTGGAISTYLLKVELQADKNGTDNAPLKIIIQVLFCFFLFFLMQVVKVSEFDLVSISHLQSIVQSIPQSSQTEVT